MKFDNEYDAFLVHFLSRHDYLYKRKHKWVNGISINFYIPIIGKVAKYFKDSKTGYINHPNGRTATTIIYDPAYDVRYATVEIKYKDSNGVIKYGSELKINSSDEFLPTLWKAFCRTVKKRNSEKDS